MPVKLDPNGGSLSAKLSILNAHVGTYAVDIWDDSDGSGTPSTGDKFLRRAKEFGEDVASVRLGSTAELTNKTVRFIWAVTALNAHDAESRVRIELLQGGQAVPGFPKTVDVSFRDGKNHDVFSVFYFLNS